MSTEDAQGCAQGGIVTALYISDNGRIVCAGHGGAYLAAALMGDPRSRLHFTPLGSWVRVDEPTLYGCEECGARIPGAVPVGPTDPRESCAEDHVDPGVGGIYDWSWAGRSARVVVEAVLSSEAKCQAVLVAPVGGGESFCTDTCLLQEVDDPVACPCQECGAEAEESCRSYCTARPEDVNVLAEREGSGPR